MSLEGMVAASAGTASLVLFVAGVAAILVVGILVGRRSPHPGSGEDRGPWVPRAARRRGPLASGVARIAVLGLIMSAGFVAVLAVGSLVGFLARIPAFERLNHDVLSWFVGHRVEWLNHVMATITGIGSAKFVIFPLAVIAGIGFSLWYDNPLPMVLTAAAVIGVKALQHYLIQIVHGAAPPAATAIGPTGGYPSGGSARVVAMFGMVAFLFVLRRPHARWLAVLGWTLLALLAFGEGYSRVYLGRHWLMDVVGGLLIGALWLGVLAAATRLLYRFDTPDRRRRSVRDDAPFGSPILQPAEGTHV